MAERSDKLLVGKFVPESDPFLSGIVAFGNRLLRETPVNGFGGDFMDPAQDVAESDEQEREEGNMSDDDKRAFREGDGARPF